MSKKKELNDLKEVNLFTLTKYAYQELLLESLLESKGSYQSLFIERYKKKKRIFKIKVITTKIFYSIIFGILPIFLVLTYLQIIESLVENPFSAENIILTGSLYFGLYFVLQFFNFFLMGLLESSIVMSGTIFRWFQTLPISRERIKKLIYLTIFRSFDIPIAVIILGFPILILIGTQNIFICLICLGISILNFIFSFDILILLGERLNRVLNPNRTNSKKALKIRLIYIISYLVVILGSIYTIQWIFGSINEIFEFFLDYEQAQLANIILSTVPYPFNPSYLISLMVTPTQASFELLIGTFVGLAFFILIIWSIHLKTLKVLSKITFSYIIKTEQPIVKEKVQVKIKTHTPVTAFLLKDLSVASHDIKVFLSMVMPIILSCIFTFSFNIGHIYGPIIKERDFFIYWIGIMFSYPILSGMIVYGITSIDISGTTVISSLPIIPRDQAKAKLILMLVLQMITIFIPTFLYITNSKFYIFFLTTIVSVPFLCILLILTFEMKINFFNKTRNYHKIEEINQNNRLLKWILILSIQYIFIFWLISMAFLFYFNLVFLSFFLFFIGITFICFIFAIGFYNVMFPNAQDLAFRLMKFKSKSIYLSEVNK